MMQDDNDTRIETCHPSARSINLDIIFLDGLLIKWPTHRIGKTQYDCPGRDAMRRVSIGSIFYSANWIFALLLVFTGCGTFT
jgi:hypothetical protein